MKENILNISTPNNNIFLHIFKIALMSNNILPFKEGFLYLVIAIQFSLTDAMVSKMKKEYLGKTKTGIMYFEK